MLLQFQWAYMLRNSKEEELRSFSQSIKTITGLTTSPVAVKFLQTLEGFEAYPVAEGHQFCQIREQITGFLVKPKGRD